MSINIFNRWQGHYTQIKTNKHSDKFIEDVNTHGITSFSFEILQYVSITEFRETTKLKGKQLENSFRSYLLKLERSTMKEYSINFCYNKDKK